MFNELNLGDSEVRRYFSITTVLPAAEVFPAKVLSEIERFQKGERDNLIIHGFPIPEDLPNTPTEIRNVPRDIFPVYMLESIGNFLGKISAKEVENTIRFRTSHQGIVNEETWHGHYQHKYSVFYCLRADPEAKTYFFSTNTFIKEAPKEIVTRLMTPFAYFEDRPPFAIMTKGPSGYELSHEIYDRSDFEKYVKDLDLPDVVKALEKIQGNNIRSQEAEEAVDYLLDAIKNRTSYITYKPGDIAMYNESCTMRFSPQYTSSTSPEKDRWILALAVI